MQKIQQKRPYLAPEITVVDFKVERGLESSAVQVKATQDEMLQYYSLLGLSQEQYNRFYGSTMPGGNSGYFSGGGSEGSYFGGDGHYF